MALMQWLKMGAGKGLRPVSSDFPMPVDVVNGTIALTAGDITFQDAIADAGGAKVANGVATLNGDNVVVVAVPGKKIRVLSYGLQAQETGAVVVAQFQDAGSATNRSAPWRLFSAADGSVTQDVVRNAGGDGHWYFETAVGAGLDLNLSGATDVGWEVSYLTV